jgi:hypothetical protein
MSRIPTTAIPHAWAEDSPHAQEVRRARGEDSDAPRTALWIAGVGLAAVALTLLFGRRSHA